MLENFKIITYHYVREKSRTYPYLNILSKNKFQKQIKYLISKKKILSPHEIHYRIKNNIKFESNEFWLTFDDGYKDHYNFVIPILDKYNIKASFYPANIDNKITRVMNVNKVQFILSKFRNKQKLFNEIKNIYLEKNNLISFNQIIPKKINGFNKFDELITKRIKFLLSVGFPNDIKNKIINFLFKKYITNDEKDFAEKLYLNISELKEINKLGNEIGGHGRKHLKLEFLSYPEQIEEIHTAKKFLIKNKLINNDYWSFCYPHGSYNKNSLKILKKLNASCALTIKEGKINRKSPYEFSRLDTNKLRIY